ncbi:hypothetical protein PsorP6_010149 [Peronosclerospora sorghi]|uniref:Uncharacterized protein n=1 Tax=Peronosclerospora sorghi TaxID=230839 RepID=A0ACC0VYA9_9STRA|nr:hypothetical protein PsorP6_010149 [Peronosclerospora sorghi]
MDGSLLDAYGDHLEHADEDDELLWNELKDDDHTAPFGGTRHPDSGLRGHTGTTSNGAVPLPSLRVNVHLPAISTLFREVLDTAIAALPGLNDARINRQLLVLVVEYLLYQIGRWTPLLECHRHPEKGDCAHEMEHYITCRVDNNGQLGLIGPFYFAMFVVYRLSRAFQLVGTLRDTSEMEKFYKERLHIGERQVQKISWDEVVTRVLDLVNGAGRCYSVRTPEFENLFTAVLFRYLLKHQLLELNVLAIALLILGVLTSQSDRLHANTILS